MLRFNALLRYLTMNLILCCYATIEANDEVKARFLSEYPESAKKIARILGDSSGEIEMVSDGLTTRYVFFMSQGNEKILRTRKRSDKGAKAEGNEKVTIFGPNRFFVLNRVQGGRYSLKSIGSNEIESMTYENYDGSLMMLPLGSRPAYLMNLMNHESFELVDVKPADMDAGKIQLNYTSGKPGEKYRTVAVLNPSNLWALTWMETRPEKGGPIEYKCEIEYGEKNEGFAAPKRAVISRTGDKPAVYRFLHWNFGKIPVKEFGLEKYGLPDVVTNPSNGDLANRRPVRTSALISFFVVAAMAVMATLVYRRNRSIRSDGTV